jgi:hypothetical protein
MECGIATALSHQFAIRRGDSQGPPIQTSARLEVPYRLDFDDAIRFPDREKHCQRRTFKPKDSLAHRFAGTEWVVCQLDVDRIRRRGDGSGITQFIQMLANSASASGIHTTVNRLIRLPAGEREGVPRPLS